MTREEAEARGAHCSICPLAKSSGPVVPPAPAKGKLRLIVVGDNPGRTEEKLREPFTGMGGAILKRELLKNGIRSAECHFTNVALCRGDSDKENERAAECCAPRMLGELSALPSGVPILSLGKAPLKALLGMRSILVARGFIWAVPEVEAATLKAAAKSIKKAKAGERKNNIVLRHATLSARAALVGKVVLPSLHPGFVLRADTWNPVFQLDARRTARVVRGDVVEPYEDVGEYRVGGLDLLAEMGSVVSLDVETDGIDTRRAGLLCVGISDGEKTVVLWPWRAGMAAGLSRFLHERDSVVAHNGLFDIPVLRNHGVE